MQPETTENHAAMDASQNTILDGAYLLSDIVSFLN